MTETPTSLQDPNTALAVTDNADPKSDQKRADAQREAMRRFDENPDWVVFYREILGVGGLVETLFPTPELRAQFEESDEYVEIQQMLARLRERQRGSKEADEPTRVITVRLPQSLHEALRHEAHQHRTSMNKLCISKLLQVIDEGLVPSDFERRDSAK